MYDLLLLSSFTEYTVSQLHPCCSMDQYSISFYCQIIFHCVDIPHFSYSSVDGYLGCLHFWAVIGNAAMNICVQVLCGHRFSILLGI